MNAITRNSYSLRWQEIGKSIRRPRAIVCISAHWYLPARLVTAMPNPRTIHDFGGFPRELYTVDYPAPGDPELAGQIQKLLTDFRVELDTGWGLDHGTWSVLRHVFPNADIPVIQLSIDETQPAAFHYDLAQKLKPLRRDEVLVVASGNIVHNLHSFSWGGHPVEPFDWGVRFETVIREALLDTKHDVVIHYEKLGKDARLSAPTPDHYLPLVYAIALQEEDDSITFPVEGFDGGSVSMLTVQIGV